MLEDMVFDEQLVSIVLPDAALLPAAQGVQANDDPAPEAGEYVSAGHFIHALSDEAPRDAEYLPGWHFEQSKAPATDEYLPSTQSEHIAVPT